MIAIKNRVIGGTLLFAGTAIGAGMLAFPISTGPMGFGYSSLLFFACYLFMLGTLFCLLEVCLFTDDVYANLSSLYKTHLGHAGQLFAWVFFLFLLYSVAAAYFTAGGSILAQASHAVSWISFSERVGMILFAVIFGFLVYLGTRAAEYFNRFFMIGLVVSYLLLIYFLFPKIDPNLLTKGDPTYIWSAMPIVVLAFTSHILLPSVRSYLGNNKNQLKAVLFLGTLLPLIFYLLWQFIILGVVPIQGEFGLLAIGDSQYPVVMLTESLQEMLGLTFLAVLFGIFSFIALSTSSIAVSLGLSDFFMDGLKLARNYKGRAIAILFAFLPPLLFALFYPEGFMRALGFAGLCVIVLYGILPVLMVWRARYVRGLKSRCQLIGGKFVLSILLLISVFIILVEILNMFGYFE